MNTEFFLYEASWSAVIGCWRGGAKPEEIAEALGVGYSVETIKYIIKTYLNFKPEDTWTTHLS